MLEKAVALAVILCARCKILFTSAYFLAHLWRLISRYGLGAKSHLRTQVVWSVSKFEAGINVDMRYGSLLKSRCQQTLGKKNMRYRQQIRRGQRKTKA